MYYCKKKNTHARLLADRKLHTITLQIVLIPAGIVDSKWTKLVPSIIHTLLLKTL